MTGSLLYRNQSIDLGKSVNWFLFDRDLGHERINLGRLAHTLMFEIIARFHL